MYNTFKHFSRIAISLGVAVIIVVLGSAGFMIIEEDYSFVEAFYMTVITISTVGFREVHELGPSGMIFTSFLIITSIGTFAYTISAVTTYFVAGEYKDIFKTRQLQRSIESLKDHIIVCGYGRVGEKACSELWEKKYPLVVIEMDEEKANYLREHVTPLVVLGDASVDEKLLAAGLERAKAIICTLPSDADNLYAVLAAREINPGIKVISRASRQASVKKLRTAGADNVIMPDTVGGAHMASLVATPDLMDFLDHVRIQGKGGINLEEIDFLDLPSNFRVPTLGELDARNRIGVNVIGVKTADGEFLINPGPSTKLDNASKLFVLGNKTQIELLNRLFGFQAPE